MNQRNQGRAGSQSQSGGSRYGTGSEYDMRDYNDGRGRDFGSDDGRWQHTSAPAGSYGMNDRMVGQGYQSGYGRPGSGGMSSPVGGSYGDRQKGGRSGYADVSDLGRGGGHAGGVGSGIDYGAAMNRGNQEFARERSAESRSYGGPKNYTRSDERIREDLCDRLLHLASRGHLDPSEIEVTVKDGAVTLSGTVPQREWKHRAEDLAESILGVKDVDNRIRVQRSGVAEPAAASKTVRDVHDTTSSSSGAKG